MPFYNHHGLVLDGPNTCTAQIGLMVARYRVVMMGPLRSVGYLPPSPVIQWKEPVQIFLRLKSINTRPIRPSTQSSNRVEEGAGQSCSRRKEPARRPPPQSKQQPTWGRSHQPRPLPSSGVTWERRINTFLPNSEHLIRAKLLGIASRFHASNVSHALDKVTPASAAHRHRDIRSAPAYAGSNGAALPGSRAL